MAEEAFETGSVTSFSGATGLLQALMDFVLGTEVSAENLSGSGDSWSGTLANYPVGYGRLTVDYTIAGQSYQGTDDGSGNITGSNIDSGTIDYTTGDYDITFSAAVTGTPTADYLYGEPGQDWKQLEYRNTRDALSNEIFSGDCKMLMLQNTGKSGQESVMLGIREWKYPAGNAYGWNLNGYLWYTDDMEFRSNLAEQADSRETYSTTWNTWTNMPNLPLVDSTIYYWFFSNRQRIIVAAKVQSNYETCYLGFGTRYASPSRYPAPLVIKGSHYGNSNHSATGDWRRGIHRNQWGAYGYPLMVVSPGSLWIDTIGSTTYLLGAKMNPGDSLVDTGVIGKDLANEVFSLPVSITQPDNSVVWMDLDGVVQLMAGNILSEDIVRDRDRSKKYRVFQDVSRTGYQDFFAVEQGPYTTTTTSSTTSSTTTTTA